MSVNTLYIENPSDGTGTYSHIEVRRDTDSYAAQYALPAIDLTTRTLYGPGYTSYVDTAGTSSTKYKVRYYSVAVGYSDYSAEITAGNSGIIAMARTQLKDTDSTAYIFSDSELQEMESRSVDGLFPQLVIEDRDATQTLTEDQIDYALPVGAFRILRLYKGALADNDWEEIDDYDMVSNGINVRLSEDVVGSGEDVLTIDYTRPYRHIGEVPTILHGIILNSMLAECFEILANDRGVKFKAFAAQTRDSDVRPETLQELANKFRALAEARKREIERG